MAKKTETEAEHEIITLKTEVRELPVRLSPDELFERAQQLADCHTQLAEHDEHASAKKKELAKARQEIVTRRAVLSGVVKRREEPRQVRVSVQTDMTERVYREVREDTGEVIAERPLRPEEMQRRLGLLLQMPEKTEAP